MGFEFQSEESRNPTNVPAPVIKTDDQAELAMMTNFLQDNGYILMYDNYKAIIKERERIAKLEETHNGFEQVE